MFFFFFSCDDFVVETLSTREALFIKRFHATRCVRNYNWKWNVGEREFYVNMEEIFEKFFLCTETIKKRWIGNF